MTKLKFLIPPIVFILSLEILLRLVGVVVASKIALPLSSQAALRIAVLGESTSADNFQGLKAWPQQLQEKLTQLGYDAKISNYSKPGTSSYFLVKKLEAQLPLSHPDLVIAMMGINDNKKISIENKPWLRHFYLYQFYQWVVFLNFDDYQNRDSNLNNRRGANVADTDFYEYFRNNTSEAEELRLKITDFLKLVVAAPVESLPKLAAQLQKNEPKLYKYILFFVVDKIYLDLGDDLYVKHKVLNHILTEQNVFDENIVYYELLGAQSSRNYEDCEHFASRMAEKYEYSFSERQLNILSKCSALSKTSLVIPELIEKQKLGFRFSEATERKSNMTFQSYRRLYELSQRENFKLILMQYPLKSIDEILYPFEDSEREQIQFLSNEQNFKKALLARPYGELFLDKFAGQFGHTSESGSDLIVSNVMDLILKVFPLGEKR